MFIFVHKDVKSCDSDALFCGATSAFSIAPAIRSSSSASSCTCSLISKNLTNSTLSHTQADPCRYFLQIFVLLPPFSLQGMAHMHSKSSAADLFKKKKDVTALDYTPTFSPVCSFIITILRDTS